MNKILSFILIGLILPCTLFAQKVKLDKKEATVNVIDLPYAHLEDVKTYTTTITNNSKELWSLGLNKTDLERQYLKLHGFQRVAEGGDILLELTIGKFEITKEEKKETTKSVSYRFEYKFPIVLQVVQNGTVLTEFTFKNTIPMRFESPSYDNWDDARDNRMKYKYNWIKTEKARVIPITLEERKNFLNARYGYRTSTERFTLLHPSTKKNPEYKDFVAEVGTMTDLLAKIEAKEAISDEIRTPIEEILKKWKAEGGKIASDNKDLSKLKTAYLENFANVNYYLEDFDKAGQTATVLVNDKLNKSEGNKILKRIEKLKKAYNLLGVETRHFDRNVAADEEIAETGEEDTGEETMATEDPTEASTEETNENYIAAKENEARNKLLGLHEKAKEYPGKIITKKGVDYEGIFVVDNSRHKGLAFYGGTNFKFYVNEAAEGEEENWVRMRFSPVKFPRFTINEREFFVIPPKSKLIAASQGISYYILELKEPTDKMNVYKAHATSAPDTDVMDLSSNLWVKKHGKGEDYQNLDAMRFLNFKKGFAKYMSDCPKLADRIKNGQFKRNLTDLTEIAMDYNDCK
ncbi:MAG: hypothetical protein ACPGVB_01035 [Chitinophagales bacterium]